MTAVRCKCSYKMRFWTQHFKISSDPAQTSHGRALFLDLSRKDRDGKGPLAISSPTPSVAAELAPKLGPVAPLNQKEVLTGFIPPAWSISCLLSRPLPAAHRHGQACPLHARPSEEQLASCPCCPGRTGTHHRSRTLPQGSLSPRSQLSSDPCEGPRGHQLIGARAGTRLRPGRQLYLLFSPASAFAFLNHAEGAAEAEIISLEEGLAEPARARRHHLHSSLKASSPGGGGGRRKSPVPLRWHNRSC